MIKEKVIDSDDIFENSINVDKNPIFRADKCGSIFDLNLIQTGIFSIDKVLGGGIPKGRLTEIYGNEGCGKTTFILNIIKYQHDIDKKFKVLFIDSEFSLNLNYCKELGIDLKRFYITQPKTAEEALELIEKVTVNKKVDLIVLDSVASLVPQSEMEGNIGDVTVASLARVLSGSLKKILFNVSNSETALVFINQLRSNIQTFGFGAAESTSGGKALRYFSSLRIEIVRISFIKYKDKPIGNTIKIRTTKNKVSLPFQEVAIDLYFGKGFSKISDVINLAILHGIIEKNGSWYVFEKDNLAQGKENLTSILENNSSLLSQIESKLLGKIKIDNEN